MDYAVVAVLKKGAEAPEGMTAETYDVYGVENVPCCKVGLYGPTPLLAMSTACKLSGRDGIAAALVVDASQRSIVYACASGDFIDKHELAEILRSLT